MPVAPAASQPTGIASPPINRQKIITSQDLNKPEVRTLIREKAKEKLTTEGGQVTLGIPDIDRKIEQAIAPLVEQKIRFTIDIPDVALISKDTQRMIYQDFDLDTKWGFDFTAPSEEIVIESLQDNTVSTLEAHTGVILSDTPENLIIAQILNMDSMIDYDEVAELLYKLAGQALTFISKDKPDSDLPKIVARYKQDIARLILSQMKANMDLSEPEFEIKLLRASSPILQQDYTKFKEDEIVRYTANIPAYEIKKKVVDFFEKACHDKYKFDSVPEHVFSIVLERDDAVRKWLRPATHQFKIWWKAGREYEPDFVVETDDSIYIVEIKAYNRTEDDEVQKKAAAARAYCKHVNTLFEGTGRKPWKYMLLEDRNISRSSSFVHFVQENERFGYEQ